MNLKGTLDALSEIRTRFDPPSRARRLALLNKAVRCRQLDAAMLPTYHDLLLFMAAYPDNAALLSHVEKELLRVGAAAALMTGSSIHKSDTRSASASSSSKPDAKARAACRKLADTGIVGTITTHAFTLDMMRWIHSLVPCELEANWRNRAALEKLEERLPHLCLTAEQDGLIHRGYSTREWLRLGLERVSKDLRGSQVGRLIQLFDRLEAPPALRDYLFESAGIELKWTHREPASSRTGARFPDRPVYFQSAELIRSVDLLTEVSSPFPRVRPASRRIARQVLTASRFALSARRRETDPLTFANEREVMVCRLKHGIDVAVFGMTPRRRLPIESYFGFMAARNRVPMAYGGGWVLGDRCEIGVNIFDEFRGGESALLFAQIMRAYRHLFSCRRFLVDPFQFGADNEEAIRSGAFWFYYRLGFRPVDPDIRILAEREAGRIQRDRSYRSSHGTLRSLAGGKVRFDATARGDDCIADELTGDFELPALGVAVTKWIGRRFKGDRGRAESWSVARAKKIAFVTDQAWDRWSADERRAFCNLSPLLAMLKDTRHWSAADRRAAGDVLRSKGGERERDYADPLRQHRRLLSAWSRIAGQD